MRPLGRLPLVGGFVQHLVIRYQSGASDSLPVVTQKNEMTRLIKNIFITILASTVISCNGQAKKVKQSLQAEKGSEMVKIPIPENGFSNTYLDKDGTLWFSSNGGGIFHYDGKAFKNYTEKNGLSSNQACSITSDHKNNMALRDFIWVG
ncbi:MAG: hypothetical protein IPL65_14135 [Lewinellaceae bacterium]|nr:hypothetical protein [Lewinellaceae bacterium]